METKTEKHLLTESDMQTLSPDLEKTVNGNTLTQWKTTLENESGFTELQNALRLRSAKLCRES